MIKKTYNTLKDNPIILLILMIPFVYTVLSYTVLSEITLQDAINSGASLNTFTITTWIVNAIYYIGWIMFLHPPIIYYIYEAVDNKNRKGWYKRGLKYWWRPIVFGLYICVIFLVAMIPLAAIMFGLSTFLDSTVVLIVISSILVTVMTIFTLMGEAAVFAEEDFGTGISNLFEAVKKYFFKVLPVALISLLPAVALVVLTVVTGNEISGIATIIFSFVSVVLNTFTSVYCMHCYVEYKNNRELVEQEI